MTPAAEPAYVAAVLMLFLDLPDTPLRPGPRDQWLARRLRQQGVPFSLVESALLFASLRRLIDLPTFRPYRRSARSPTSNPSSTSFSSSPYPTATSTTFASNSSRPPTANRTRSRKRRFLVIANSYWTASERASSPWRRA